MLKRTTSSSRSIKSTSDTEPASSGAAAAGVGGGSSASASEAASQTGGSPDNEAATSSSDNPDLAAGLENLDIMDGQTQSEASKFKQLVAIMRKALNVKDLTGLRVSLPANLMEPVGNLEYWNYLDRPDFFAAIGESDDQLERFVSVLRWTFTKDLKFVKGKIAKPYNSILGEHFHAYCDTEPVSFTTSGEPQPHLYIDEEPSAEVLANAGLPSKAKTKRSSTPFEPSRPTSKEIYSEDTSAVVGGVASSSVSTQSGTTQSTAPTSVTTCSRGPGKARVVFLNEQTSHHPPISHFVLESRGPYGTVRCTGADQVSAKFTGTALKVFPGPRNKGLFLILPDRDDEEYQITHPTAVVTGLVRASPYATISECTYITQRGGPKTSNKHYRAIISYPDEAWLSKAKFLVEGVIYSCEGDEGEEEFTKVKQVPVGRIVATFNGCWRGQIRYTLTGQEDSKLLVDMVPLLVAPKSVAPIEQQDPLETRKVWDDVSQALLRKDFSTAGKNKRALEQRQRDNAEARKKSGEVYTPRFFQPEAEGDAWGGRPTLTQEGSEAIEKEFKAEYPKPE
ncbi:hypothetical protein MVLG_04524 [Microbotryum lychnidis-dioicae p1A1 Lamole]|uniref:Oxysterol-binding protein n=1 Tax=Microbotryum lychnidis-dioicae (strain p1A1 Lamole / MvSl-1064) TaxID=683840 RepID=U5HBH4_USTV1|nr:hypothetical protein MVLG_04524 [Microbotryum lychnidis-dioicae p1A1 Lamole]|eukprot:KDE05084.1 hypothetical protein MVLG_04524 [Microbotryum lychnidis-dioicae p1A1 Lamole]